MMLVLVCCAPCGDAWIMVYVGDCGTPLCPWKTATDSVLVYFESHEIGDQRELRYTSAWLAAERHFYRTNCGGQFHFRRNHDMIPKAVCDLFDYCNSVDSLVHKQLEYNDRCAKADSTLMMLEILLTRASYEAACNLLFTVPPDYDQISRLDQLLVSLGESRESLLERHVVFEANREAEYKANRAEEQKAAEKRESDNRDRSLHPEVYKHLDLIYQYLDRCTQWVWNIPVLDYRITGAYTPCQWVTMNVELSTSLAREEMNALNRMNLTRSQQATLSEYVEWETRIRDELARYCP